MNTITLTPLALALIENCERRKAAALSGKTLVFSRKPVQVQLGHGELRKAVLDSLDTKVFRTVAEVVALRPDLTADRVRVTANQLARAGKLVIKRKRNGRYWVNYLRRKARP